MSMQEYLIMTLHASCYRPSAADVAEWSTNFPKYAHILAECLPGHRLDAQFYIDELIGPALMEIHRRNTLKAVRCFLRE